MPRNTGEPIDNSGEDSFQVERRYLEKEKLSWMKRVKNENGHLVKETSV